MTLRFQTIVSICIFLAVVDNARADWRDEIGYTRLNLLAGSELPDAPAQGFTQVEALESGANYQPDTASTLFTGKTFASKSGTSGTSGHATSVATNFYGNSTSLVTGDCPVDLYSASGWLGAGFLKVGTNSVPATESRAVQNHSWISTETDDSDSTEANRRLDFAINRDGFVCVVGVNNGNSTTLPQLLGQSHHTISVGLVNGGHSAGFTTLDDIGRIKPDIVAPDGYTSFSTPMVASAAGLLYSRLSAAPYSLAGADLPRVIKALLLASATKDTVPAWANTSARPLDLRYGAGELNVNHAYNNLRAGRATASATSQPPRGWAAESVSSASEKTYFFTIPAGASPTPFSAALTWHRVVEKNGPNNWTATLANLSLRLHHASGTTPGAPIAESLSTVDNVELVHQSALPPGDYALKVQSDSSTATPYALAWHSLPTATMVASGAVAREIDGQAGLITVSRTGNTTLPLLVPLVLGGNAVAGSHFQALPSSITIPAGATSVTLQIIPISDGIAQGNRTLIVSIAADFALVRDATQTSLVTIQDKPFDAWRFENFTSTELENPEISDENSDPDGDNLANLIEYALALDPRIPSLSTVTTGRSGGYLALAAGKNTVATDVLWNAEVSANLESWQPAVITTNSLESFEARDTILADSTGKRFIRLKITRP